MTALLHTAKSATVERNIYAKCLLEFGIFLRLQEQVELTMDSYEFLG